MPSPEREGEIATAICTDNTEAWRAGLLEALQLARARVRVQTQVSPFAASILIHSFGSVTEQLPCVRRYAAVITVPALA